MKILLGIPTSGAPAAPFLDSLSQVEVRADFDIERLVVSGNFVPAQRELIAQRALSAGADALIMCDDDMIIPAQAFTQLIDVLFADASHGLVGALYYSRDGFRPMVVDDWDPANTTSATIPAFGNTPVRVDGVGFGCVAIRTSVLAKLPQPWFDAHVYVETDPARVRVCNEDYLFGAKLISANYRVILHAGVCCGHYDRSSGQVQPLQWEPVALTSQRRIAALVDGKPALVPFTELATRAERHEAAHVTYVMPS